MTSAEEFRRARRPEHVAERRETILRVAREMLADRRLPDVSLRELSAHVGLAKSNVLRYFESREAIYLELLVREWGDWLDELERGPAAAIPDGQAAATAGVLTTSLSKRPILCELFGTLAGVLEHNISEPTARAFKLQAMANAVRLREWLRGRLPALDPASAHHVAGAITLLVGALWAYERPAPVVAALTDELGGLAAQPFSVNLRTGLHIHLVGAVALADDVDRPAAEPGP